MSSSPTVTVNHPRRRPGRLEACSPRPNGLGKRHPGRPWRSHDGCHPRSWSAHVREARRERGAGHASAASTRQRFQPQRDLDRRYYSSVTVAQDTAHAGCPPHIGHR